MPIIYQERDTPVTKEQIGSFEAKIGYSLPPDYRAFLLEESGGVLDDNLRNILLVDRHGAKQESGLEVQHIFSFHCPGCESYNLNAVNDALLGRIPGDTIAIADDPGGCKYLLRVGSEEQGAIYIWHHDMEGFEPHEDPYEITDKLFETFSDFISSIGDSE